MQFSSRFTIAVHILLAVNEFEGQFKTTSFFLGNSVNVNPVIIRKTLGQLKAAGLVTVEAGVGGAALAKEPKKITLWDIFCAVEDKRKICSISTIPTRTAPWEEISTQSWTGV